MSMKRRKIALLLALCLGITSALTACGGSSQSGGSAAAKPAAQEEAEAPAEETAQAEAEPAAADQAADGTDDQRGNDKIKHLRFSLLDPERLGADAPSAFRINFKYGAFHFAGAAA